MQICSRLFPYHTVSYALRRTSLDVDALVARLLRKRCCRQQSSDTKWRRPANKTTVFYPESSASSCMLFVLVGDVIGHVDELAAFIVIFLLFSCLLSTTASVVVCCQVAHRFSGIGYHTCRRVRVARRCSCTLIWITWSHRNFYRVGRDESGAILRSSVRSACGGIKRNSCLFLKSTL